MPEIEEVPIEGLVRPHKGQLRIWYTQPMIELVGPPWRPVPLPGTPSGFDLLRHVLAAEAVAPHNEGPVFVLVPEYAIRLSEVDNVRQLVRGHSANVIVVVGLEQLSGAQALGLENRPDLWDDLPTSKYTNCAAVVVGSTGDLYLQPKIVPSLWEIATFTPGRLIRYFAGTNLFFIVQVCSDLLQQPASNAAVVAKWLENKGRRLDVVAWVQHNPSPRSPHFGTSFGLYCSKRATVLAAASRKARPERLEGYAVSGAVVHHDGLPRHFHLLDKEFHYFEPVAAAIPASRGVLLRYDADVYRVTTVLGDTLSDAPPIEKGTFFQSSQPYKAAATLVPSLEHFHLEDLCRRSAQLAANNSPAWTAHIHAIVADHLVPLNMRDFLAFLDLALIPRPQHGADPHTSGASHTPADLVCECWEHRVCIDRLTDPANPSASAFANVLTGLAALRASGLVFTLQYLANRRTYLQMTVRGVARHVAVVDPFGLDAGEAEVRLLPQRGAAVLDAGYIILGTQGRARRLVGSGSSGVAAPTGAPNLGRATTPSLRAIYQEAFQAAIEAGTVQNLVEDLFAA